MEPTGSSAICCSSSFMRVWASSWFTVFPPFPAWIYPYYTLFIPIYSRGYRKGCPCLMDTPSTFRFSSCIALQFTHQSRTIFSWTCANIYQVSSHYKLKKWGIPSFLTIYAKLWRIALDSLRITTPNFIYAHSSFVALLDMLFRSKTWHDYWL